MVTVSSMPVCVCVYDNVCGPVSVCICVYILVCMSHWECCKGMCVCVCVCACVCGETEFKVEETWAYFQVEEKEWWGKGLC